MTWGATFRFLFGAESFGWVLAHLWRGAIDRKKECYKEKNVMTVDEMVMTVNGKPKDGNNLRNSQKSCGSFLECSESHCI